jgi:uncharacterized integral membrane protein (TIGR00698 family)
MTDLDTDAEAAHRLFASLDGMEGLPWPAAAAKTPPRAKRWLAELRKVYPGALAAGVIGLAATWLSQHYTAPVMLFALLLGMAFHFLHEDGRTVAGIEFSSKRVLRLGVALLGARITASQILGLGVMPLVTVIVGVGTTIGLGVICARRLGLSRRFGVLSGGSVAICGASAALAIASVLPRGKDDERDTILAVVIVTALSTLAMILYPMLATGLGLDHVRAGIFLGGTIHDVAQVVGAGYTISPKTGDVATYVKLLRVTLLLPVVSVIALATARMGSKAGGAAKAPIPWFLLGFAALVVINSLGLISKQVGDAANLASRACLVTAIAALGMKTSFGDVAKAGWRPLALMVFETLWIGALVLAAVLTWK